MYTDEELTEKNMTDTTGPSINSEEKEEELVK